MSKYFEPAAHLTERQIMSEYYIPSDGKQSRTEEVERVKKVKKLIEKICEDIAALIDKGHPKKPLFSSQDFISLQENIAELTEEYRAAGKKARTGSLVRTMHMTNMIFREFKAYADRYLGQDKKMFKEETNWLAHCIDIDMSIGICNKEGYKESLNTLGARAFETLMDKFYLEALVTYELDSYKQRVAEIYSKTCDGCGRDDCVSPVECSTLGIRVQADKQVEALTDILAYMNVVVSGVPSEERIRDSISKVDNEELKGLAIKMLIPEKPNEPCRYALAGRNKRQLLNTSEKYIRSRLDNMTDAQKYKNSSAYNYAVNKLMNFDYSVCGYDKIVDEFRRNNMGPINIDPYGFFGGRKLGECKEKDLNED